MDEAMRTYFMRFRFTHPTTEDFLRTLEEIAVKNGKATSYTLGAPPSTASSSKVGGMTTDLGFPNPIPFSNDFATAPPVNSSLRPFFNQAVYGTAVLDYRVDSIASDPVQWWLPEPKADKDKKNTDYLTTVYLRRKGDFILPVTVEVLFQDGTRIRDHWDGVDRWKKLTYTRKSRIVSAEIDPDHLIPLDRDLFNNSITRKEDPVPRNKLAFLWLYAQQLTAQLAAWLV